MSQVNDQLNGPRPALRTGEVWLLLAVLAVLVIATLLDSNRSYVHQFADNFTEIIRQTSLLGIFALGAAVVIISGGIDLSSGSMIAFSGTICATIMVLLAPTEMRTAEPIGTATIALAIGGALAAGVLVGTLHAWLITSINLPPFVATLATLVGLRSFSRIIVASVTEANFHGASTQINVFDDSFRALRHWWVAMLVFLLLAAVVWLLLSRTVLGRHIYAVGGNEQAARLSGIRTERVKWVAYCLAAFTSAVAGVLSVAEQGVAFPDVLGRGYELNAIAAAVVGGCSLQGGVGTVTGTIIGALFLRVVIDAVAKVIKTGSTDMYEGLIVGIVVVAAVSLSQVQRVLGHGKDFFPGLMGLASIFTLVLFAGGLGVSLGGKAAGTTALVLTMVVLGGLKWYAMASARTAQAS